jgi:hypothetical protein
VNRAPVSGESHAVEPVGKTAARAARILRQWLRRIAAADGPRQLLLVPTRTGRRIPQAARWPELVASLVAFAGVTLAVLQGFHPYLWQQSASDFKTLYAAADCFKRGLDPYSFSNIGAVFSANRVVQPVSWYAHSPVYPPFTLALMAPLTELPMVPAIFAWMAITWLTLTFAAFALARAAAEIFLLSRPWRLALIALFAALPVLSFGVEMGNVSIAVGALSILSVALPQDSRRNEALSVVCLALALLLKPHLGLWVIVALLFTRTRAGSHPDRTLALRAIAVCAGVGLLVAAWMAAEHQLLPQLAAYREIVANELASGSMSPNDRELSVIGGQITSLASLLGFGLTGVTLDIANWSILVVAFAALSWNSIDQSSRGDIRRLTRIAAWSAFGLIATYHRAHDAVILALMLPYLLARLRRHRYDPVAWTAIALTALMGTGPSWDFYKALATQPGLWHIANFLLYRQAPFAALLLLLLMVTDMARTPMVQVAVLPRRRSQGDLAEAA